MPVDCLFLHGEELFQRESFEEFSIPVATVFQQFVVRYDFNVRLKIAVVPEITPLVRRWIERSHLRH